MYTAGIFSAITSPANSDQFSHCRNGARRSEWTLAGI
jgi:hypothetical protein